MKKEDLPAIANLLTAMRDTVRKIEEAQKNKDLETLETAKKELVMFSNKLKELL